MMLNVDFLCCTMYSKESTFLILKCEVSLMKLNIGETIKRLRKEREITQEEFSEILGVSCQSVSRWENNSCYPDIELIPTIAAFFGVSTDKLMGIDEVTEKSTVDRYLNDFQAAISIGHIDECIRIARDGVAEFPNNYVLLNKLMYALFASGSDDADITNWKENMENYDAEIVALGERIIKYCPDIEIRLEATARLAFQHCEMGRKAIGRSIYETMPSVTNCKEIAIWWALSETEKLPHTRELIDKAYSLLSTSLYQLSFLLSDSDAIKVFEKMYVLDELMYDGKPYIGTHSNSKTNYHIAKLYLRLNKNDEAMKHLKIAAQAAIAFDNRPYERKTVSFLLGEQIDKKTDFDTADSRPLCKILRDTWLKDKEFDKIRDTDEFIRIIESLS